jgi:aryl-phospho-beta-D-glucosidase BglC (GH1 family)
MISLLIMFVKFLEYFFTDKDASFFKSLGLNCIRIPFNYRHFEGKAFQFDRFEPVNSVDYLTDDMNPRILKLSGFKHLDRVIDLCSKHGIHTILDLHTSVKTD